MRYTNGTLRGLLAAVVALTTIAPVVRAQGRAEITINDTGTVTP
jgi:hypothetical protein